METKDLHLIYTRNGTKSAEVNAPVMRSYDRGASRYDEFPQGISITGFDSKLRANSHFQSNYAIYMRDEKIWDARYDVLAVNEKGDSILTEQIFWNEAEKQVYTTANVRVKTPTATIFGRGLVSDDRFMNWEIKEITGSFSVPKTSATTMVNAPSRLTAEAGQEPEPITFQPQPSLTKK